MKLPKFTPVAKIEVVQGVDVPFHVWKLGDYGRIRAAEIPELAHLDGVSAEVIGTWGLWRLDLHNGTYIGPMWGILIAGPEGSTGVVPLESLVWEGEGLDLHDTANWENIPWQPK